MYNSRDFDPKDLEKTFLATNPYDDIMKLIFCPHDLAG
jgi:hypothetical protein